jgi:hypothetical protein
MQTVFNKMRQLLTPDTLATFPDHKNILALTLLLLIIRWVLASCSTDTELPIAAQSLIVVITCRPLRAFWWAISWFHRLPTLSHILEGKKLVNLVIVSKYEDKTKLSSQQRLLWCSWWKHQYHARVLSQLAGYTCSCKESVEFCLHPQFVAIRWITSDSTRKSIQAEG